VIFQVSTAANMNMTPFWDAAPCCLVEVDVSDVLTSLMEAESTPETSVYFYETTRGKCP
jgi:hypothetical protein